MTVLTSTMHPCTLKVRTGAHLACCFTMQRCRNFTQQRSRRLVGEPMTSGVWLPLLGPFFWAQNKSFTVHIERARAIACRRSRCLGLRALKNAYRCSRWLVGEPMTSGVWLPLLGSFFLGTKKRFHCAHRARAGNCLQALTLLGLQAL